MATRDEALWVVLLIGWMAGGVAGSRSRGPLPEPPAEAPPDPSQAPPRALRRLPGLGEARALAVARARWGHPDDGPPLYLSDVVGIGPGTERAVREWLEGPHGP